MGCVARAYGYCQSGSLALPPTAAFISDVMDDARHITEIAVGVVYPDIQPKSDLHLGQAKVS